MIEWNKVTWYSKIAALVVFVAALLLAFHLGRAAGWVAAEATIVPAPSTPITTSTPAPTASTTPGGGNAPNIPAITNADQDATIALYAGERFAVDLGNGLNWTISFDPSSSIEPLGGSLYEAIGVGTTTLHGTGAPICKPGEACPDFLVAFTATLVVR